MVEPRVGRRRPTITTFARVDLDVKEHLERLVQEALLDLRRHRRIELPTDLTIEIERTRHSAHGDYASNVALKLARALRMPPRELAQALVERLSESRHLAKVTVADPGFINFTLSHGARRGVIKRILELGEEYGHVEGPQGESLNIEFVSANPTGPLHVGHGRGAAFGASLANLLAAQGHPVVREYYINDYGRQMDILATSVWLRYLELVGVEVRFPDNGYKGEYVIEVARSIKTREGDRFRHPAPAVMRDLPPDESQGGDKEAHVDALIERARSLLGATEYAAIYDAALQQLLEAIRDELLKFNVRFDTWFSERALARSGAVEATIAQLQEQGQIYEQDGALWFRATAFGDEKDRVVRRENGQTTYFASDIAYLRDKFGRGFDRLVYVLGADHHGYIARLRAAAAGLGYDPDRIEVVLVQFAKLFKDGVEVPMGKREGNFVTLRDLREDVGTDAARFFYVMRSHEQHLDFDLELAKKQSADNPVYYVQYAHARIHSVFRKAAERGLPPYQRCAGEAALDRLTDARELELMSELGRYPEVLAVAAQHRAPHMVANYLRDLAAALHGYYDGIPRIEILTLDEDLRQARLALLTATRLVLANGLKILGVGAPESM
jgi:arginyl-tRNA synthetase